MSNSNGSPLSPITKKVHNILWLKCTPTSSTWLSQAWNRPRCWRLSMSRSHAITFSSRLGSSTIWWLWPPKCQQMSSRLISQERLSPCAATYVLRKPNSCTVNKALTPSSNPVSALRFRSSTRKLSKLTSKAQRWEATINPSLATLLASSQSSKWLSPTRGWLACIASSPVKPSCTGRLWSVSLTKPKDSLTLWVLTYKINASKNLIKPLAKETNSQSIMSPSSINFKPKSPFLWISWRQFRCWKKSRIFLPSKAN